MSTLAESTAERQHRGQPCSICGIPSKTGKTVLSIGWVGPSCALKVAALQTVLEREGLSDVFETRLDFEPVPSEDAHGISSWDFPQEIVQLRGRAERLGLRFEWHWPRQSGPAWCCVSLPRPMKLRRRLIARLERLELAVA